MWSREEMAFPNCLTLPVLTCLDISWAKARRIGNRWWETTMGKKGFEGQGFQNGLSGLRKKAQSRAGLREPIAFRRYLVVICSEVSRGRILAIIFFLLVVLTASMPEPGGGWGGATSLRGLSEKVNGRGEETDASRVSARGSGRAGRGTVTWNSCGTCARVFLLPVKAHESGTYEPLHKQHVCAHCRQRIHQVMSWHAVGRGLSRGWPSKGITSTLPVEGKTK